LATTLPEFSKRSRFASEVKFFRTESARPCLSGSKIAKKAFEILPQEAFAVIIEGISAPDLRAAFLGKQHVYTAGEAIVWAAALGPASAARAALVAKTFTPLAACAASPAGFRVFQGYIQVRRRHGHQVLDALLVQRLHQLAQARKG
jgi:hypothetical protein